MFYNQSLGNVSNIVPRAVRRHHLMFIVFFALCTVVPLHVHGQCVQAWCRSTPLTTGVYSTGLPTHTVATTTTTTTVKPITVKTTLRPLVLSTTPIVTVTSAISSTEGPSTTNITVTPTIQAVGGTGSLTVILSVTGLAAVVVVVAAAAWIWRSRWASIIVRRAPRSRTSDPPAIGLELVQRALSDEDDHIMWSSLSRTVSHC